MAVKISNEIKPFLDDISERLWSGNAAIMVGAGFSKNADPVSGTKNTFPTWAELGDVFFEKVNGTKPKENDRYLDAPKLADEVSAAFGRPALEQILRNRIDDSGHKPNDLFHQLLELNWSDVFTTNYDTLLERAKDNITDRNYQTITSKDDLINSQSPRIIKLHGSFPSHTPFIISEEDYRTYPRKFAPFVNTVQQTLLEKSLCLIGFSGDDPNFLQWIGWIRDNFPDTTPLKIYLVGIIRLSETQKKLLDQRHINIVDFSSSEGINGSHAKAFEYFFSYLKQKKIKENFLDWPDEKRPLSSPEPNNTDKASQLVKLIPAWKDSRLKYPGWRVVPRDRRSVLYQKTQGWVSFLDERTELDDVTRLNFLYELSWRLEKCLCVTWDNIAKQITDVLDKFWPLLGFSQSPKSKHPKSTEINANWVELSQQCIYLRLCLLRYYREEGHNEEWNKTKEMLTGVLSHLSPSDLEKFSYECALQLLFQLDLNGLKDYLEVWSPSPELPFWVTKRAGLLAELGEINKASQDLEEALVNVRKKLNLKPITVDYSNISDESYILYLLFFVKSSEGFLRGEWDFERNRVPSDRRNFLYQYKCDPWAEISELSIFLEKNYTPAQNNETKQQFDIGQTTEHRILTSSDEDKLKSYQLLRLHEEVGLPFQLPQITINKPASIGSIERIKTSSPHWALVTLLRTCDEKAVDKLFSREALSKLSLRQSDQLIETYINALKTYKNDIESPNQDAAKQGLSSQLGKVLPEILSRLVTKCSPTTRETLLDFVIELLNKANFSNYRNIRNLQKRLFATFGKQSLYSSIPKVLEIKIPVNYNKRMEHEIVNPFLYIKLDKSEIHNYKKPDLDKASVTELIEKSQSENDSIRGWALFSLFTLFEYDLLDEQDISNLVDVAWSRLDKDNFPSCSTLCKSVWAMLPAPEGINVHQQVRELILSKPLPIQKEESNPNSFSITNGHIDIINEALVANRSVNFEEQELEKYLEKILQWWSKDKVLLEEFSSRETILEELQNRFFNIPILLAFIVIPKLKHTYAKEKIDELLHGLAEHGIPVLRARATLEKENVSQEFIQQTINAIGSNELKLSRDALGAIEILCDSCSHIELCQSLLNDIVQAISWGVKDLSGALMTLNVIFTKNLEGYTNTEPQLLRALSNLAEITEYDTANDSEIDEFLNIREKCTSLASTLYNRYYKKNDLVLPKEIELWRNISQSEEEFSDVKAMWTEL